jgi:hypothetical protein
VQQENKNGSLPLTPGMYEDVVGLYLLRVPIYLEMTQSCVKLSHADSACKHATPEDAHNQASAKSPYKPKRTGSTKATSTSSGTYCTQRCIATHTPYTCAGTAAALLAFMLLHHLLQLLVQGQL